MAIISVFLGTDITMTYNKDLSPRFEATYLKDTAVFEIETMLKLHGKLPQRAIAFVLEWAIDHRKELFENWELLKHNKEPKQIEPLV